MIISLVAAKAYHEEMEKISASLPWRKMTPFQRKFQVGTGLGVLGLGGYLALKSKSMFPGKEAEGLTVTAAARLGNPIRNIRDTRRWLKWGSHRAAFLRRFSPRVA